VAEKFAVTAKEAEAAGLSLEYKALLNRESLGLTIVETIWLHVPPAESVTLVMDTEPYHPTDISKQESDPPVTTIEVEADVDDEWCKGALMGQPV
jgi:hypothetical protein